MGFVGLLGLASMFAMGFLAFKVAQDVHVDREQANVLTNRDGEPVASRRILRF